MNEQSGDNAKSMAGYWLDKFQGAARRGEKTMALPTAVVGTLCASVLTQAPDRKKKPAAGKKGK